MIGKLFRFWVLGTLLLSAVILAGCTTAASEVSASDAWVRAAASDASGGMDMGSESTMNAEADTPSMDMESGTPASEAESSMPAMGDSSGGGVSAAYMTLTNGGGAADRLISAVTDAAGTVELHTSELDSAGVMRMRPLMDGLEIPANGSVMLEPGGYHIMLMDLQRDLVAGERVTLTLTFASGKTLTVEAEIRPPQ